MYCLLQSYSSLLMEFNDIQSTQQTIDCFFFFPWVAAKQTVRQHLAEEHAVNSLKGCIFFFLDRFAKSHRADGKTGTSHNLVSKWHNWFPHLQLLNVKLCCLRLNKSSTTIQVQHSLVASNGLENSQFYHQKIKALMIFVVYLVLGYFNKSEKKRLVGLKLQRYVNSS